MKDRTFAIPVLLVSCILVFGMISSARASTEFHSVEPATTGRSSPAIPDVLPSPALQVVEASAAVVAAATAVYTIVAPAAEDVAPAVVVVVVAGAVTSAHNAPLSNAQRAKIAHAEFD